MDEATGELIERRLDRESGEAHPFYRNLPGPVRAGIEATGPIRWCKQQGAKEVAAVMQGRTVRA